jgi:hypothetical protein
MFPVEAMLSPAGTSVPGTGVTKWRIQDFPQTGWFLAGNVDVVDSVLFCGKLQMTACLPGNLITLVC